MVRTLSYTNVSISIVLVLIQKCIVYQHMGICCKISTFYCCISIFLSELEERASSHCSVLWYTKAIVYQQNDHMIRAGPLKSTCLQRFVHVCIQVIELQELACRIVMYGLK